MISSAPAWLSWIPLIVGGFALFLFFRSMFKLRAIIQSKHSLLREEELKKTGEILHLSRRLGELKNNPEVSPEELSSLKNQLQQLLNKYREEKNALEATQKISPLDQALKRPSRIAEGSHVPRSLQTLVCIFLLGGLSGCDFFDLKVVKHKADQVRHPANQNSNRFAEIMRQHTLVDPQATKETKMLFANLKEMMGYHLIFGHHATMVEGKDWRQNGVSDVKRVSGHLPMMVGFDFYHVMERPAVNRPLYRQKIIEAHKAGAIVTISWHMNNPVSGGNFYDKTPAVKNILPGGDKHNLYKEWLDAFAEFVFSLKDENGDYIPVIFRPFHEHNGNWFWWSIDSEPCKEFCLFSWVEANARARNDQNFRALWQFTVEYLRDRRGIRSLLYAYSPGLVAGVDYFHRYPGNRYVDILGLDKYVPDLSQIMGPLRKLVQDANRLGKIPALTETGSEGLPDERYWTEKFYRPIYNDPIVRQLAYVMVWRNSSSPEQPRHFYAPYPGHNSIPSFLEMARTHYILLSGEHPYQVTKELILKNQN